MKLMLMSLLFLMNTPLWADAKAPYPCQVRLIKTDCWKDVEVTVIAKDSETHKNIGGPIVLAKDSFETMQSLPCQPSQTMNFSATVLPTAWEGVNTVYPSINFFNSPSKLPKNAEKWIVSLCFPDDFSSVPLPLSSNKTCRCHFEELQNSRENVSEALGKAKGL